MNLQNLEFFDKYGEAYNFQYNSQFGYWEGKEWLKPTSINLFDSVNIFILEKDLQDYKFPKLNPNDYIYFKWKELEHTNEFFLYNVTRETVTNNQFIQKEEKITYNFSDYSNLSANYIPKVDNIVAATSGQNINVTFDYITPEWSLEYTLWNNANFTGTPTAAATFSSTTLNFNTLPDGEYSLEIRAIAFSNNMVFSAYRVNISLINGVDATTNGYLLISNSSPLDLSYPLQVNVAFNPLKETEYIRTLEGFYVSSGNTTKIVAIEFYGEGEEEDERLKVWSQNFGIKFNKEDALILKDYDIKEGLPDIVQLNQIRKDLLVSKDQIFPYIGTYKALSNFINILGYKDILKVKEYWKNVNSNSEYYNKMGLVDITDFLDDGTIDNINFLDLNKQIKFNNQFKKTSMLALVYEFTKTNGDFDDDGIPVVERTTEFSVDEIFFKLNKLGTKLKREILPLNIQIKDIIGEFIFFQRYSLRYWTDRTDIEELEISKHLDLKINQPAEISQNLEILDISSLYSKKLNAFPVYSFNNYEINPLDNNQIYNQNLASDLIDVITNFYTTVNTLNFTQIGQRPSWESYDEPLNKIGCPIILEAYLPDYPISDLDGVTLHTLGENKVKVGSVKYANYYEVGWKIKKTGNNPYYFEYRGDVSKISKLPHVLPSVGDYQIECRLYDLFGGTSYKYRTITVEPLKPVLLGVTRINDKFDYTISNLKNIQVKDLNGSYVFNPRTIVLDNNSSLNTVDIDKKLLDWASYQTGYGFPINMLEVEIENDNGVFEPYITSSQSFKKFWGTAENTFIPKISDYQGAKISDIFHSKIHDLSYQIDFQNGFTYTVNLTNFNSLDIKIGGYNSYIAGPFANINDLILDLNTSSANGITDYVWSVLVGSKIQAQAKYHSKQLHNIFEIIGINLPTN